MAARDVTSHTALRWWLVCAVTIMVLVLGNSAQADGNPRYAGIVVDLENGEVLYSENADAPRYPASLTKMMTIYLALEAVERGELSFNQPLAVSAQASAMPATKLWLSAGSTIDLDTAIRALTVRSANDVAVVVAEALGGSEQRFASLMTAKARELGMNNTTFRNASGLPDSGQITTARDMLILSTRVMQDFPQYYHYFGLQEFSYKGTRHTSHNRLVRDYPGADGLKTGFIRASGFNVATTAVHDGRRMIAVVMGGFSSSSRDAHMADLLDRSFARARLRDNTSWMADTNFSREFMSFGRAPVPLSSPPPSTPPSPILANIDTTTMSPSATAGANMAPTAAPVAQPARPSPEAAPRDPLRALINEQQGISAPALAVAGSGGWGIQVGAFSQASHAEQLARQAAQHLPNNVGGRVAVDAIDGQTPVFRARVVALDEARAIAACQTLHARGMDCMVVNASL
ncbi:MULTISPECIES: serine hydrolase [unclassified Halomonas]|uniref:serine hydrolase n=1 Tax=unclassified Halomonas TaxID=2609666 RepID=UPI0021E4B11E|nr:MULTISPECIES: serine hydrolase [unclassified Halomonas]UYG00155.1 SPOR domain-containing protein [Halomonas sp. GD1P12]WNL42096.1 serine hydrolase [Halomonas sp. PAMB 3264]